MKMENEACNQRDQRWSCTLDVGHSGQHEAHGSHPLHTWTNNSKTYNDGLHDAARLVCAGCRGANGLDPVPFNREDYQNDSVFWHKVSSSEERAMIMCLASAILALVSQEGA